MNIPKGINTYKEGRDFVVTYEEEITPVGSVHYTMFFKNPQGNILGYFVFNVSRYYSLPPNLNIQSLTTASGFSHLPEDKTKIYIENGYTPEKSLRGFGEVALQYIFDFVKMHHPEVNVVRVCSFKENKDAVMRLIENLQRAIGERIERVMGPDKDCVTTLILAG